MAIAIPAETVTTPRASIGYWRAVAWRLRRDPTTLCASGLLLLIVLSAVLAPALAPHDPYGGSLLKRLAPIGTPGYPLGTDEQGRDMLSRLLYGGRMTLVAGITPVVITGRDSKPLRGRIEALGIAHVHYSTEDKLPAAEQTLKQLGLEWSQAAAIGDDWPDLAVLRRCAFAAAPANAHAEVKAAAAYVTQAAGGHGAAREFCDLLVMASGRYGQLLETYG